MRIENAPQIRPEVRKPMYQTSSSHSFGQMLIERTKDRYVPSTPPPRTEPEFSLAERTYYGSVTVSNATQAKLKQLAELNAQADYTGMSPDEIYAEIWNRYDEAFGRDMIAIKGYIAGPAEWCVVNNQFCDEVTRHIFNPAINAAWKEGVELDDRPYTEWTYEEKTALDRSCREKADKVVFDAKMKVLGYDGMSFDEREAAIREKYAGKNTTIDFLKMQNELQETGVLNNKMGWESARLYRAMLEVQLEDLFNPNSISAVGYEKHSLMTADQWYRVANQPFDTAKLAADLKKQLAGVKDHNGFSDDYVKMMEGFFDHFVTGVMDDSLDRLLSGAEK